jgi:regulator of cell morphogenesis and NO signaling
MPSPATLPNHALVAHIVEHHHAYARRALPYIVPLLSKITGFHRGRNRKLSALCDAGHELADALEAHCEAEERELFPELLAGAPREDVVRRELDHLDRHHREVDLLLARIRWLADDYGAPEWAGRSYRVLMEELAALEDDVREHLHLERNVLIPRLSSRCREAA